MTGKTSPGTSEQYATIKHRLDKKCQTVTRRIRWAAAPVHVIPAVSALHTFINGGSWVEFALAVAVIMVGGGILYFTWALDDTVREFYYRRETVTERFLDRLIWELKPHPSYIKSVWKNRRDPSYLNFYTAFQLVQCPVELRAPQQASAAVPAQRRQTT